MIKKKNFWLAIGIIAVVTLIVPFVVYVRNFPVFSSEIKAWVAFANYLSLFASLFSGCAIFLLTWYIFEVQAANEKERDKDREAIEKARDKDREAIEKERAALEKPFITFRRTRRIEIDTRDGAFFYEMINGGRSSALACNVYIRNTGTSSDSWDLKLICYTLIPLEILPFLSNPTVSKILVVYKDIYDDWYTAICENDVNSIESGKQSPGKVNRTRYYDEYIRNPNG